MEAVKQPLAAEAFANYLQHLETDNVQKALATTTRRLKHILRQIPKKKWDYAYAPGKWTLKEVFQHMLDTERVFSFRALWFSRNDPSPLPGFEENNWASSVAIQHRPAKEIVKELLLSRKLTRQFFKNLSPHELHRQGQANGKQISVQTLGLLCAGHLAHHLNSIEVHYLDRSKKKKKSKP
jgi:uncharacterized damage-inducible protein DinB